MRTSTSVAPAPRSFESFVDRPGRSSRTGYLVGAVVNAVMLWAAHQVLIWQWPPFITGDFDQLLPIITVSLAVTIAGDVASALVDTAWFRSLCTLVTSSVALAVAVATWRVFPFAFAPDGFDWALVLRTVLVVAIAGSAISMLVEIVRLIGALARRARGTLPAPADEQPSPMS